MSSQLVKAWAQKLHLSYSLEECFFYAGQVEILISI